MRDDAAKEFRRARPHGESSPIVAAVAIEARAASPNNTRTPPRGSEDSELGLVSTSSLGGSIRGKSARLSSNGGAGSSGGCHAPEGRQTGWVFATFHIICAVVGAGILSLPNALAWLGLPAGLALLAIFYLSTLWTLCILAEAGQAAGSHCGTYRKLVLEVLGARASHLLAACQYVQLVLVCVGYTVTAGGNISNMLRHTCAKGHPCEPSAWSCCLLFGALQLMLSQLPSLESAWWSSLIGAAMSIVYSGVAFGLGAMQAGNQAASLMGREAPIVDKTFGVFESLGTFAFSFSFAAVLVEIQATLAQPPPSSVSMKKAITAGISTSAFLYTAVAMTGYMALGDAVPGDILEGFARPKALVSLASFAVLVHMVMAYQVFAQPVFELIESSSPTLADGTKGLDGLYLRLVLRSLFVLMATMVAAAVPFFAVVIAFIGAITFWLPSIHLPIVMFDKTSQPPWHKRVAMYCLDAAFLLASLLAVAASARTLWLHIVQAATHVELDVANVTEAPEVLEI